MELIATCAFGLEKLVYDEIKKLGFWVIKTEDGRVTFKGEDAELIKANLWLRCADRVQIKMDEFKAVSFDELFDAVNGMEWEKYIGVSDSFPVQATSVKSILHSEPAIQGIVKKAIVKRLQQTHKIEVFPENSGAIYQVVVKVNKDEFIVCIDSSGDSLHRRGYRFKVSEAPIKETLAAAMVMLSDWTPKRNLVDCFCGTGTIAIEASLIAHNIAPGLRRQFAFHKWNWVDQKVLAAAYVEARQAALPIKKLPIYCFDNDPNSLLIAEDNSFFAGFETINYKCADFNKLDFSKFENCTFISNPPYGVRLEDKAKASEMYKQLGQKFARTKNCSMYIIVADENFPQLFGRPADKNRKLFNGKIRCYLFSFS
jgi:putative N6-adenine-specific DNA methylase